MKDTRSESERQTAVRKLLKGMGFSCWSTSQTRRSRVTPGVPDLFVAGWGVTAWIEMKATRKQSPAQIEFQETVEANGGIYVLAYSEQDVAEWLNSLRSN